MPSSRTQLPAWRALAEHRRALAGTHLRELFAGDPGRHERFSIGLGGLLFDYSKQRVTADTMRLLVQLARECELEAAIERLLSGERVNFTENRPALHTALRAGTAGGRGLTADVLSQVRAADQRMEEFCVGVRSGAIKGATGEPFADIVNIGIGGSSLGPALACEALAPYASPSLKTHFVSNADGHAIAAALEGLDAARTLFIVASKTLTTHETLANVRTARDWLAARLGPDHVSAHFCAVTANPARAHELGIAAGRVFQFWDWVGGRYSLWSAIGLPVALACGMDRFGQLRAGARAMDEHFAAAPPERNMPVIMGLLGVWCADFLGAASRAVLPYDERLRLLPAYLQQLEMESCGKRATRGGEAADYATAPVVWGTTGTDAQHSYFQLLHQGSHLIPADFIACGEPHHRLPAHHEILLASFFSQTEALMRGRTGEEAGAEMRAAGLAPEEVRRLLPHRVFAGNRPTSSILLDRLDPAALGALIALYEHKVYVESVIWEINAFDQWGVELGKQLAERILPELDGDAPVSGHDASTNGLINHFKQRRRKT